MATLFKLVRGTAVLILLAILGLWCLSVYFAPVGEITYEERFDGKLNEPLIKSVYAWTAVAGRAPRPDYDYWLVPQSEERPDPDLVLRWASDDLRQAFTQLRILSVLLHVPAAILLILAASQVIYERDRRLITVAIAWLLAAVFVIAILAMLGPISFRGNLGEYVWVIELTAVRVTINAGVFNRAAILIAVMIAYYVGCYVRKRRATTQPSQMSE